MDSEKARFRQQAHHNRKPATSTALSPIKKFS